jgi:hypothetical protein
MHRSKLQLITTQRDVLMRFDKVIGTHHPPKLQVLRMDEYDLNAT